MSAAKTWDQAREILCVRLDGMGDLLMTIPAIRALKDSGAGRRITLLTSPAGANIAPYIPEVDEYIVYEAPWMKATPRRDGAGHDLAMIEQLRERRFDAAVVFTVYSQSALPAATLTYMAEIPLRLAHCRERAYQLLTDAVSEREPEHFTRHEVQRQLDLVATIGAHTADTRLAVDVPATARWRAMSRLSDAGIDLSRPWVVVHPGATAPSRRYSPQLFGVAVRELAAEHGIQVVLTGDACEAVTAQEVAAAASVPLASLAGQLDIPGLAAVLSLASVVVTNNTGPAHLAAAVETPVVDLYALTNPQHTPWGVANRLLYQDVDCKFCYRSVCPEGHHACLALVPPERVTGAVLDLLEESRQLPADEDDVSLAGMEAAR